MKSPFTGKEMKRVYEKRTWNFRGEQYKYEHISWLCEDSGEQFTDDESDTAGFIQITNQYRAKYGIPYTDEIIAARQRYGISAAKMSLILGIGINQYRLYEQGEVPNVSNGRMIRSIMNPKVMLEMVESSKNELSVPEYEKIISKVKTIISNRVSYKMEQYGVLTLTKALNRTTLYQTVKLLSATSNKIRRLEENAQRLEKRLHEMKTVNKAKGYLIEFEGLTEEEAHKFIEKDAMDNCIRKIDAAKKIIDKYEF